MTMQKPMRERMFDFVCEMQREIVAALEQMDPEHPLLHDKWTRHDADAKGHDGMGGGGESCVLQDGKIFEKAGVNVSRVFGNLSPPGAAQMRQRGHLQMDGTDLSHLEFFATGVSLVLHPHNPMAATVHANYRYFEIVSAVDGSLVDWWFGGGSDLTPAYVFPDDCRHFHLTHKLACDIHNAKLHPRFKKWCDEYFYIPHREECRGVGGIFFDDVNYRDTDLFGGAETPAVDDVAAMNKVLEFVKSVGKAFLPAYIPLLKLRMDMPYTDKNKHWQQVRRGRYVEFNLVNDRGTKFGLATPGSRTESILMSLPRTATWEYCHKVDDDSEEAKLLEVTRNPVDWLSISHDQFQSSK